MKIVLDVSAVAFFVYAVWTMTSELITLGII
jgi:hypothetical protein